MAPNTSSHSGLPGHYGLLITFPNESCYVASADPIEYTISSCSIMVGLMFVAMDTSSHCSLSVTTTQLLIYHSFIILALTVVIIRIFLVILYFWHTTYCKSYKSAIKPLPKPLTLKMATENFSEHCKTFNIWHGLNLEAKVTHTHISLDYTHLQSC
jgi:hypothetical protein